MSCWDTFQNLEGHHKNKILTELQAAFGGSIEFEASIYLMQWLELQPWQEAINVNLQGTNVIKAKQLMDATIAQLNDHKKKLEGLASISLNDFHNVLLAKKVQDVIQQLEVKYGSDPVKLAEYFHGVVSKLRELVQSATSIPLETLSTVEMEDMDTEENAPPDQYAVLKQQLEILVKESQKNDALLKEIEQLKEQYVIKFQEVSGKIDKYQMEAQKTKNSSQLSENDKKQRLDQIKQETEKMQHELSKMGEELSIAKRLGFIECLCTHLKKLSDIVKTCIEEIAEWRHLQQRSLCGFPCPPPLDKLQEVCETLAELLWKLFQQASQLDNLFHQAFQGNEIELKRMDNVKTSARNLMRLFLNRTFIIEKQPPQVLKIQTKFGVAVRHLLGDKLNVQIHPPEVTCSLISEKQAQGLHTGNRSKSTAPSNNNPVLNSKKALEFNQVTGKLIGEFKNLSLTKATRQGGKNKEVVTEEKSSLLFTTQINLGKEQFNISVMSVPVVVTVHGNQQCEAEATVFWDNAFAEKERKLFDVPDQVEWSRVAEALNKRWVLNNEGELSPESMAFLGTKLFPGKLEGGRDNAMVTRQMFYKDHVDKRSFSFWKWFFGALDVVSRRLLDEWKDGRVAGFLSKNAAHDMLSGCNPGTFLLRFSEGEVGGVSVAYVSFTDGGPCEVYDVAPWTNAHLQMRKFSDRLKDLEELVYLYPHIDKNDAFGQYYTNDENAAAENTEYQQAFLAVRLAGKQGGKSPMYQAGKDGSM
ncbi:signal transducer and activator of transcription 5B-like isoform X3 [Orbicella faveolata]|nr:signal transducer and activator of transcription 5B-like isoform X3 [Orbicella faveolata]